MLGAFHTLTLTDAASRPYVQHPSTTDDIKALCADLKVLNKADYKNLLRWRLKMSSFHKELEAQQQGQGGGGGDDAEMGDGSDDDSDDDDQDAERRRIAEQRALRDQAKADCMLLISEMSISVLSNVPVDCVTMCVLYRMSCLICFDVSVGPFWQPS